LQCKNSWELALNLSKNYVKKPYHFHEVIINFDKKEGFYQGNSLGIALSLSFLEQILMFYNPTYLIKIKEQTALTGGITETGKVLSTSEEIIKQKVANVFYSELNSFVLPKCDEPFANYKLNQLKLKYPNRNLKLILVDDINDVLNRRDVVDIQKQKLIVRSAKFIKKNWLSAAATLIFSILFAYLYVLDLDDNPNSIGADGNAIYIKNKNGKVLWKINSIVTPYALQTKYFIKKVKIVDINNDGVNEVISCLADYDITKTLNYIATQNILTCFDKTKKIVWTYQFKDYVKTSTNNLDNKYGSNNILDTITFCGE